MEGVDVAGGGGEESAAVEAADEAFEWGFEVAGYEAAVGDDDEGGGDDDHHCYDWWAEVYCRGG